MAQGNVAGEAGLGGQGDADDAGGKGVQAGGFRIHGGEGGRGDAGQPGFQGRPVQYRFVAGPMGAVVGQAGDRGCAPRGGNSRGRRDAFQLPGPAAKAVAFVEGFQGGLVRRPGRQLRRGRQLGKFAIHGDQFPAQGQKRQVVAQVLAHHPFDLVRVDDDFVQAAVLLQPFDRRLGAALGHSGNVVHRVPHQGQVIDDAVGGHAELGQYPGFVEDFLAHGIDQPHRGIDQLGQVLVAGGDHRFQPGLGGPAGESADHVVGFHPVHHQQGPAGGLHGLMDGRDLQGQVLGHGRPVGLVFRVPVVPEGLALGIEDHRLVVRLEVTFQAA